MVLRFRVPILVSINVTDVWTQETDLLQERVQSFQHGLLLSEKKIPSMTARIMTALTSGEHCVLRGQAWKNAEGLGVSSHPLRMVKTLRCRVWCLYF